MKARVQELPQITLQRLRNSISPQNKDRLIVQRGSAGASLVIAALCVIATIVLFNSSNSNRFSADAKLNVALLSMAIGICGSYAVAAVIRWNKAEFKKMIVLNPLYIIRFNYDEMNYYFLPRAKNIAVERQASGTGTYVGTRFQFYFEDGMDTFIISDPARVNSVVDFLNKNSSLVAEYVKAQDWSRLYEFDVLYEFNEQRRKLSEIGQPPIQSRPLWGKIAVPILGCAIGLLLFFAVDRYNDYSDDRIRYEAASNADTAAGYRLYIAQRPEGRYVGRAHSALDTLYEKAARDFRAVAVQSAKKGIEAVIAMLNYANRSGKYRVAFAFDSENLIPKDVEDRLRRLYGVSKFTPIEGHFEPPANRRREVQVLDRVSTSFRKVIPADILEFVATDAPSPDEIAFVIAYKIRASRELYYPERQAGLPLDQRMWYTGIVFDWHFKVTIPGGEETPVEFDLQSNPAEHFTVEYSGGNESDVEYLPATTVYDGMAKSAFDDFYNKLLVELSVVSAKTPPDSRLDNR